jgi:hypothetical protein
MMNRKITDKRKSAYMNGPSEIIKEVREELESTQKDHRVQGIKHKDGNNKKSHAALIKTPSTKRKKILDDDDEDEEQYTKLPSTVKSIPQKS